MTKKIVKTALLTTLVYIATMIIKIPSPMKGYINVGDCIVLLCGWLLSPGYGFIAAGLGSALAEILSGYVTYAPATFLIKGCMALVAFSCFQLLHRGIGKLRAQMIGGVLAEIVMVGGYFLFEGLLYGFTPSLVNIPANLVQGVAGFIFGVLLIKIVEKLPINMK